MQGKKKDWPASLMTVYTKANCVFTAMVLHHLDELGIEYEEKDIKDPEIMQELIELTGKWQTPYLFDIATGEGVFESADIVAYLDKHYGTKEA